MTDDSNNAAVPPEGGPARSWMFRLFQFRLLTLLLLMIPLGVGFVWVRNVLDKPPIDWIEYSPSELANNIDEGRTVIVFVRADWDPACGWMVQRNFESAEVRRAIRRRRIVMLKADYTHDRPEVRAFLDSFDSRSTPLTVIYSPSLKEPIVIADYVGQATTIELIEKPGAR